MIPRDANIQKALGCALYKECGQHWAKTETIRSLFQCLHSKILIELQPHNDALLPRTITPYTKHVLAFPSIPREPPNANTPRVDYLSTQVTQVPNPAFHVNTENGQTSGSPSYTALACKIHELAIYNAQNSESPCPVMHNGRLDSRLGGSMFGCFCQSREFELLDGVSCYTGLALVADSGVNVTAILVINM